MKDKNGVKKFSKHLDVIIRRKSVIVRLENQLKSGIKPVKKSTEVIKLSQSDINRINKEIDILKSRLL